MREACELTRSPAVAIQVNRVRERNPYFTIAVKAPPEAKTSVATEARGAVSSEVSELT